MLGVCGKLYSVGWDRHQVITLMSAMQRSFSAWDKESERKMHGRMAMVEVEVVPSCSVLKERAEGEFRTVIHTDSRNLRNDHESGHTSE